MKQKNATSLTALLTKESSSHWWECRKAGAALQKSELSYWCCSPLRHQKTFRFFFSKIIQLFYCMELAHATTGTVTKKETFKKACTICLKLVNCSNESYFLICAVSSVWARVSWIWATTLVLPASPWLVRQKKIFRVLYNICSRFLWGW